jgi:hypothetical protein
MAQAINLEEYKRTLLLDPQAPNDGTWYARSTIHHDTTAFKAGQKLPQLTNEQVVQLLDVNALTSVAPAGSEQAAAVGEAGNQDGATPQGGHTQLDEKGQPVQQQQ